MEDASLDKDELRKLIDHQERIREDERKRIAREIHDDLGQHLLAFRIEVSLLKQDFFDSKEKRDERVDEILEHVDATMKSIRILINNLRPAVLDLGLVASLEWQAKDFSRRSNIECIFLADRDNLELDDERATVLFRILQEALTNVAKHAKATQVSINLSGTPESLNLQISDNGIGMPKIRNRKMKSFGLAGIRERIGMLNGEFKIVTGDHGTILIFNIPF